MLADRAYNIANPVTVTIGGMTAEFFGAALESGNASVVQVAIRVPPNALDGDLPLVASAASLRRNNPIDRQEITL
ncbi:MAG: hypothetical protein HYR60_18470 [Acidobacteria bacterium]|nr:hypothetical protein [Acidobacteriota bacterium]